jgi:hypothetical protein
MPLTQADLNAVLLSLQLASLTTVLLLLIGTPIAWWLAQTDSWLKKPLGAIVALPLVLPPTVPRNVPSASTRSRIVARPGVEPRVPTIVASAAGMPSARTRTISSKMSGCVVNGPTA